jgi:uncharacterized membrane protein SpoIIM required for sporulation
MDLDRYLATHEPKWKRLEELSKGGRRGLKRRTNAEVDELVSLYQQVSSDLSHVRTYYRDQGLIGYLTGVVNGAGNLIYGTKPRSFRSFGRFFSITFPAALWHARRALLISTLAFFIPAVAGGVWVANSDAAANAALPEDARDAYIEEDFEEYYASERASQFSALVATNNVQVSVLAFGSGIALAVPTIFVLAFNGVNIGTIAGIFNVVDQDARFYGLILPHGLLEITAILIAGAAGLRIGWSIISPGDRTRSESLARESLRAVTIIVGLVPVFVVAGLIEGFVTGQPWPAALRVGIGTLTWAAFLIYVFLQGRKAEARGFTGTIDEQKSLGWAQTS